MPTNIFSLRSPALQTWIMGKSHEEMQDQVAGLPKPLYKELLREALYDDRIQAVYENNAFLPVATRELMALKRYVMLPEIYVTVSMHLPGMNEGNVPSSNLIDTSSLFLVQSKKNSSRDFLINYTVCSRKNTTIIYTGERLYQGDWNVLHVLIDISKHAFNRFHTVRPKQILDKLGLSDGGGNYDTLLQSLVRLSQASMHVEHYNATGAKDMSLGAPPMGAGRSRKINVTVLHLIQSMVWKRGDVLTFSLDSRLVRLFANSEYGLVDWNKRCQIRHNELAQKLQCLFSGQKANQQFHNVEKLRKLAGIGADVPQFTRHLRKALNELVAAEIIHSYWLSQPKRGETSSKRVVCIWKKSPPSPREPIPGNRGAYVSNERAAYLAKQNRKKKASLDPRTTNHANVEDLIEITNEDESFWTEENIEPAPKETEETETETKPTDFNDEKLPVL